MLLAYKLPDGCKLELFNETLRNSSYGKLYPELDQSLLNISGYDHIQNIVGQNCSGGTPYSFVEFLLTSAPRVLGLIDGYAFPTGTLQFNKVQNGVGTLFFNSVITCTFYEFSSLDFMVYRDLKSYFLFLIKKIHIL